MDGLQNDVLGLSILFYVVEVEVLFVARVDELERLVAYFAVALVPVEDLVLPDALDLEPLGHPLANAG